MLMPKGVEVENLGGTSRSLPGNFLGDGRICWQLEPGTLFSSTLNINVSLYIFIYNVSVYLTKCIQ